MASSAKVTITLGRSGQVVKRQISDFGNDDELPVLGRKRPVRERLGNNVVDSDFYGSEQRNKRRQTESNSSLDGDDGLVEAHQVGKDDLRLKLLRKGLSQKINGDTEQNGVDLREKLSRNSRSLPRYDARVRDPESRSSYDVREVPESRSTYGLRERVPESRASTLISQMSSGRREDNMFKLDSSGKSYSSWTNDCLRRRSPDKLLSARRDVSAPRSARRDKSPPRSARRDMSPPRSARRGMSPPRSARIDMSPLRSARIDMSPPKSARRDMPPPRSARRGMSPPRTYDQTRPISSLASGCSSRSSNLITRDAPGTSRPRQSYDGKSTVSMDAVRQVNGTTGSCTRLPTATASQEVRLTVTGLLNSLGLEKYDILFKGEEVDMAALSQMKDSDLKDMGVPMGPRKKILLAVAPYSKQRQR